MSAAAIDAAIAEVEADAAAEAEAAEALESAATRAADDAVGMLCARLRQTVLRRHGDDAPLEACLCALILAIEPNIRVAAIVDAIPSVDGELGLTGLLNTLANIGYRVSSGYVAPAEIDRRLLPCLMIAAGDDPSGVASAIVLRSVTDTPEGPVFTVFCGFDGATRSWTRDDLEARTPRRAFFFRSVGTDAGETQDNRAKTRWFSSILGRFAGSFWLLSAIGVTLSLVGLSTPLFIMLVYDRTISPRTLEPLPYLLGGAGMAIAMEWYLRSLRAGALAWLAARLDYIVGAAIFERLIGLPATFLERAPVAAQIARIRTFESIRDFFNGPVFMSALDLPAIVVSIVVIAIFGGMLALVPIAVAMLYVALFVLVRRQVKAAIRTAAKATSATQQFAIETFEKLEAIRANGLASAWQEKYRELSGRENLAQFRLYFLGNVGEVFAHALTIISAMATLAVGVGLIWRGEVSAGALVASMILTWRVLTPFHSLCTMIPRFEQMRNAVLQIDDLMELPTEAETEEVSARPTELKGRVAFGNASLRYSREAGPVFLGLNAEIKPGEIVAITGANGAGKSSVLKLALGLYPPLTGSVRVDGFDLRQLARRDLRRLIAYVPQAPDLLDGTIADNLRFGKPLANEDELWRVLDDVGAAEEVRALPDQLDTPVAQGGASAFSATLCYRIAFARALLHNSALLLLDEQPNAALNAGLADVMKQVIRSARGKRTVIFVSHRQDLIGLAEQEISLKRGHAPAFAPIKKSPELAA